MSDIDLKASAKKYTIFCNKKRHETLDGALKASTPVEPQDR